MSLSSVTRRSATGEVKVDLVLNGVEQKPGITKGVNLWSALTIFDIITIKVSDRVL